MCLINNTINLRIGIDAEWDDSFGFISLQIVDFKKNRKKDTMWFSFFFFSIKTY